MMSSLVPPFGTDGLILGPWLTDYEGYLGSKKHFFPIL